MITWRGAPAPRSVGGANNERGRSPSSLLATLTDRGTGTPSHVIIHYFCSTTCCTGFSSHLLLITCFSFFKVVLCQVKLRFVLHACFHFVSTFSCWWRHCYQATLRHNSPGAVVIEILHSDWLIGADGRGVRVGTCPDALERPCHSDNLLPPIYNKSNSTARGGRADTGSASTQCMW